MSVSGRSYPIPFRARVSASAFRAQLRAQRWGSGLAQRTAHPKTAILGCYDTGNIGDLALGWTLRALLRQFGLTPVLQPLSAMENFPQALETIVGGGGILTCHPSSPLQRLAARGASGSITALAGVSGFLAPDECSSTVREFLSAVPCFSVRSRHERDRLSAALGRDDIAVHPDIAFGLKRALRPRERPRKPNVLGLSVSPFLFGDRGGRFHANEAPSAWFARHLPEEASVYSQISGCYVDALHTAVRAYIDRGWTVRLIPFAIEDDLFARAIFGSQPVDFVRYSPDPISVFEHVSECARFIATRFHSHVFALLSGVPCLSMAYAGKCRYLWEELGLDTNAMMTPLDLVHRKQRAIEALIECPPVLLDATRCAELQDQATQGCFQAVAPGFQRSTPLGIVAPAPSSPSS